MNVLRRECHPVCYMQEYLIIYRQRVDSYPISIYKIPELPTIAVNVQSE
jgi:hypothetical protein